jgi:putative DNA primase/helicase
MNRPDQFREAIQTTGLIPPDVIEPGKLHRFPGIGKRNGNTAGWCKLFNDGVGGVFGDWAEGFTESWQAKRETPFTLAERETFKRHVEEARAQAKVEREAKQAEAAGKAAALWKAGRRAHDSNPYLIRKDVKAVQSIRELTAREVADLLGYAPRSSGEPLSGRILLVPIKIGDALSTLELIDEAGRKSVIAGGAKAGGYWAAQPLPDGDGAGLTLLIGEGVATVLTAREATGHYGVAALSSGNLEAIAQIMRHRYPAARIIILTDVGNGQDKARKAALAAVAHLAIPDFGEDRQPNHSDMNDLAALRGKDAVIRVIDAAVKPDTETYRPPDENAAAGEYASSVELLRGSEIRPEPVTWLWSGWLAAGKMHVLGGAPGTGKTTISMALAATLTIGGRWPDGSRSPAGNVVIWSGEDDPADTLIPRLALSGADLSRVYFIDGVREGNERRSFDPARDMEVLRRKLEGLGDVRLLIVDPIVSAIAGDSHKNAEVRRGLQPLADLAASMRCALLGITHFSKGTNGREPVERLTGSLAFGALARVVLVAAKHQEEGDDGRTVRLLLRAKSNIGPDDGGFEYDLQQSELKTHPGIFASSVVWGDPVEGAARELLATADAVPDDVGGDSVASVSSWLNNLLTEEGGCLDRRDVMKAAHAMGHKERTVHRAREKLGLVVQQNGFGKDKRSIWTRPDSTIPASIVPIVPNKLSGTHGTNGGTHEENVLVKVEI